MDSVVYARYRRSKLKAILSMARANLESWFYSPRTLVALVFIVAICYIEASALNRQISAGKLTFFYTEALFDMFNGGSNILMTSTMLLITVSELPKRISFQNNALIRGTRREFLTAQIVYCLGITMLMILVVGICASIFTIGHLSIGLGWSDNLRMAEGVMHEDDTMIAEFFRKHMAPIEAIGYAIMPMFFFWLTMLLIVLLFSVCGAPVIGVVLYAFMLWSPVIFFFEALPRFPLPTEFALLRNMGLAHREEGLQYYWKVIGGYLLLDSAIIMMMLLRIKRTDLVFNLDSKF